MVFRHRDNRPENSSSSCLESNKTAVDDRNDDFTLIQRNASADNAAAKADAAGLDLWVIAPNFFSGSRVDGKGDAPVGDPINNAVGEQRRCFLRSSAWSDLV
jgi:hypothetical protein